MLLCSKVWHMVLVGDFVSYLKEWGKRLQSGNCCASLLYYIHGAWHTKLFSIIWHVVQKSSQTQRWKSQLQLYSVCTYRGAARDKSQISWPLTLIFWNMDIGLRHKERLTTGAVVRHILLLYSVLSSKTVRVYVTIAKASYGYGAVTMIHCDGLITGVYCYW